jgi:hypothetical protein
MLFIRKEQPNVGMTDGGNEKKGFFLLNNMNEI